ncbi:MAG: hypothetical protein LBE13_08070 [Bacteroidales bacterium]|jgi:hypothetical protein|nr:hypothetical protein [Bacteroidales bacterium]
MDKIENQDENRTMTKFDKIFIFFLTILFINPVIPYIFSLLILVTGTILFYYNRPYQFIYAMVFLFSFSVLVRWSSPNSPISALFRSIIIFLSIVTLLLYNMLKRTNILSSAKKELFIIDGLCIFWILFTILLLLIQPNSMYMRFMGFREYAVFFFFFIIYCHALQKGIDKLACLKMLFYSIGIVAGFNLLFNFNILSFPLFTPYEEQDILGNIRVVAGMPILRMRTLLGGSQGGTALVYTLALLGFWILPFGKIIKWIFIPILFASIICLISFSSIFVFSSFLIIWGLFTFGIKFKKLIFPIALFLIVLTLIFSHHITIGVDGGNSLSAYDYVSEHVSRRMKVLVNWDERFFIGSGFDIKTSENPDAQRMISRDNGILNAFISHGIIGLLLVVFFYLYGFYRIYIKVKTPYLNQLDKKIYIMVSTMFLSSCFFAHGLPLTSKPLDLIVFISAGILFNRTINSNYGKTFDICNNSCL